MALSLEEFDKKMQETLLTDEVKEYVHVDKYQNGLVTKGAETVQKVGFTVSANMRVFEMAVEQGCDSIVVHHGLHMQGPHLDSITNDRIHFLIQHNLSLWGAHYALDAHATLSHGAQILKELGAEKTDPLFFDDAQWGRVAHLPSPRPLAEIVEQLASDFSPDTVVYDYGTKTISRVGCVTGGGAPRDGQMVHDFVEDGIDLYISGEVSEWHRDLLREGGLSFIAGGHYHTESYGLRALMPIVESWGVETTWLDYPNNV